MKPNRRWRALAVGGTATVAVAVMAVAIGAQALGSDRPPHSSGPATSSPRPSPTEISRPEPTYEWSDKPSPVVLRLADHDLELHSSSYCWQGPPNGKGVSRGGCADGFQLPEDREQVGSPASVDFWFGGDGADFQATFVELGVDCPRQHTVQAVRTGDHLFRLDPAGLAGRYRVELFGRGRQGSVSTSFLWTTPVDGPMDQPRAYLALMTGDRDEFEAYDLELGVDDLASQPTQADAEVSVTAANGRSMVLDADREHAGERYAHGSLFFGGDTEAKQAAQLGPPPFTYRVRLTLDGKRYVGTAVWPRDEQPDLAPNTDLTFDPPLPAYG